MRNEHVQMLNAVQSNRQAGQHAISTSDAHTLHQGGRVSKTFSKIVKSPNHMSNMKYIYKKGYFLLPKELKFDDSFEFNLVGLMRILS